MSGGGGGSNEEAVKKQHEYDINKWKFERQEQWDNFHFKEDAYEVEIWNQNQNIEFREQMATDEYNHKLKMRDFDYNNQIAAYNASVKSYEKQLDYNNLAHEISSNDNTRVYNEKLTSIGFQNEELINQLNDSINDYGLNVQDLNLAKKAKDSEFASKAKDLASKEVSAVGAQAAMGQTGRTARKNMQSQIAAFGAQQAMLVETLEREGASMGLKWDQQNQQLSRITTKTELGQRQLQESMKSAGGQYMADAQNLALEKYSADIAAEAQIAPAPQQPPMSPAPLKLPRPKSLGPQPPPSDKRYESIKPIEGAISKPSGLQKAAAVIGTVAQVAGMFGISDDRLKYDITRVGTSNKGIPRYTFRYRFEGKHGPKYMGTSAQDLIAMGREDAVGTTEKDGFYYVDYSKLDVTMEVVTT